MFLIKKLITAFLIPPGLIIAILLLAGFWLWRRRQRAFGWMNILLALLLWAFSIGPVARALTAPLEAGLAIPSAPGGDVIILLGGGIYDGVPDLTGRGSPGEDMFARMVTAARLHRRLNVPVIVSGGSVYAGRSPEAVVVKRFLVDLGVRESQVLIEAASRDTFENAKFTREIVKQHRFRRPLLVTSAYHMRRSIMMFERAGVTVTPVPAQFITGGNNPWNWAVLLPDAQALQQTQNAFKEYLGLLFYTLRS